MNLRPATAADASAIAELEADLFGVDAWSTGQVGDELTGVGRRGWVAEEAAGVTGYAITMTLGEVADLQRIAVAPEVRRGGLARALLDAALVAARADGAARMLLEVSAANEPALAFYAAAGFTEIDRRPRYYRDDTDALVLCRDTEG